MEKVNPDVESIGERWISAGVVGKSDLCEVLERSV
jgi:hypothetical protein